MIPGPAGLRFCYWNIQRLIGSKLEELKLSLNETHKELDILIITQKFVRQKFQIHFIRFQISNNTAKTGQDRLGDFNIDFLTPEKFDKHSFVKRLPSLNFQQLIKVRITTLLQNRI